MAGSSSDPPAPRRRIPGAELLTLGGLGAAFGLAACCALPLLLAPLGLSTAWLGGLALIATPHRAPLMAVGAACLLGGALLLWRDQRTARTCDLDRIYAPRWIRGLTLVGLMAGAGLLWAGYAYV